MSNTENPHQLASSLDCPAVAGTPVLERVTPHNTDVGGIEVNRVLPRRQRRVIGAWCFLDHIGPVSGREIDLHVGAHPHIGLQTFTWMMQGEILHRDSLGTEQVIRPGQVNLMTAGRGIAHTEDSVAGRYSCGAIMDCLAERARGHRAELRSLPGFAALARAKCGYDAADRRLWCAYRTHQIILATGGCGFTSGAGRADKFGLAQRF
jgi:hypothetical protein